FRLRRQDGEYRWIVDNAVPRFDGEHFAGYIGSCIDIHDRKTAEADAAFLAELSEQMRQAEEAEALIVTVTRMVGDYLDATYCALAELD
ncbi:MAG TPA: PAS domain S-box protein, partial [Caldilineaceae bacterium]|nr:PAS domain S-box protein [Caldilineaceae bacterium]